MSEIVANANPQSGLARTTTGPLDRAARAGVHRALRSLEHGMLRVSDPLGKVEFGRPAADGLCGAVEVEDPRFYRSVALGGALGAGDAFVEGRWSSPDLVSVTRLFARNLPAARAFDSPLSKASRVLQTVLHRLRKNTPSGSRKNIQQHYDLSNEFFAEFLDPTMTYSCGLFDDESETMQQATERKFERICRLAEIDSSDHVVEVGCGWGSFARHAAVTRGCRVTGITISQEQLRYGQPKVQRAGLADQVDLQFRDYRDMTGVFDKLVSIEMVEAVGRQYLGTFFAKCSELLKSKGRMALQCITIPDARYESYSRGVDFIQKYIFPGGCLPSLGAIDEAVSRDGQLEIVEQRDFAEDYARTLMCWRERFLAAKDRIRGMGFSEEFLRAWDYYLCYCAGGFYERQIGLSQILLAKR
ncbi:MAG: cyclopropane-fatty-acyl-phospholipid synthase family protein [Planctomycetota bacterium]